MKKYSFTITAEMEINAENPELAEQYLREAMERMNPDKVMYNLEVMGEEAPKISDPFNTYAEEYEVKIK